MKKVYETGHAKNVSNFEQLLSACKSFGKTYSPAKSNLSVQNLEKLLADSRQALQNTQQKLIVFNQAVHARHEVFGDIKHLFTQIYNAFTVSDALPKSIEEARTQSVLVCFAS
jgi:hypothetical protein